MEITMKKIIIAGLGKDFVDFYSKRFPFGCFDVLGATDFDVANRDNVNLINTRFFPIKEIQKLQYDFIIISDKQRYEEYKEYVSIFEGIVDKILKPDEMAGFTVDENFAYQEFMFSFGEMNPDKTFYIIRPTYSIGLFACVGRALAEQVYAEENGWIPVVDMQNYPNMYLAKDKLYQKNAWEFFFKKLADYTLKEVYSSKNVVLGDVRNARKLNSWMHGSEQYKHGLWKKIIKVEESFARELELEYHRLFDSVQGNKILGVLLRGTDYVSLQPEKHPVQPSAAEMIKIVSDKMEQWGDSFIYLSTEDASILRMFQRFFGTRLIYTNQIRYENTGNKYLASIKTKREDDEIKRGKEYFMSIFLLSKCNDLITSICGGSNVVKMINGGKYKNQITIDKGVYSDSRSVKTIFDAKSLVLVGNIENIQSIAEIVKKRFDKDIYIYSEKLDNSKLKYTDNLNLLTRPFGIVVDNNLDTVRNWSDFLRNNEIPYSHINFLLKNEIDISMLKGMGKTEYRDENGNVVIVDKNVSEKIKIIYHHAINSIIQIGKTKVQECFEMHIYGNSAIVKLGDRTSIYSGKLSVTTRGRVEIGNDCLIGSKVLFCQNDNHHIFDINTFVCINPIKNIFIANHVWIGDEVLLKGGTNILDNCIVEERSSVKNHFNLSNVMIAGCPGKIVRENIVWARDEKLLDYDNYEQCKDKAALKYLNDNVCE